MCDVLKGNFKSAFPVEVKKEKTLEDRFEREVQKAVGRVDEYERTWPRNHAIGEGQKSTLLVKPMTARSLRTPRTATASNATASAPAE